jgi:hypothetical protein
LAIAKAGISALVASGSHLGRRPPEPGAALAVSDNAVSVVLPVEGFTNVARLVTGGFGAQLALGFDAIDDVQLAIEVVLRSLPLRGSHATLALASDSGNLTVTVGPFEEHAVEARLDDVFRDGLGLRSYLGRLVDSVEILEAAPPAVVLRKRLEVAAG